MYPRVFTWAGTRGPDQVHFAAGVADRTLDSGPGPACGRAWQRRRMGL